MDLPSESPYSDDVKTANEFDPKDYRGEDVRPKEPPEMDLPNESPDSDDVKAGNEFGLKDYGGEDVSPKEPSYVVVKDREDGKPRGLPCNSDRNLSLATLSHTFPGATGLEFKDPKAEASRVVMFDSARSLFMCPADGWKNQIFTAIYPRPPPPQPGVIRITLMPEGIVVKESNISLSENVITQEAVKNLFSLPPTSILKLRYGENEGAKWCDLDSTGSFLLPEGWSTMEFFVDSRLPPPPPQPRVIRIKLMREGIVVKEHKVPLSGNVITQNTVKSVFLLPSTSIVALRYGDNEEAKWCNLDSTGSFLLPDGWPSMEFFLDSPSPPPPPPQPQS
ncbi:unnamed protein product, partial [Mesorhabditis belari]|uniref:TAR DNA-binding protein 43 N-terminal domain-containing protein n=1 Tax=Mesorhabditis belari TaxID=2138241 RepID=A0AAF3J685_9BILA